MIKYQQNITKTIKYMSIFSRNVIFSKSKNPTSKINQGFVFLLGGHWVIGGRVNSKNFPWFTVKPKYLYRYQIDMTIYFCLPRLHASAACPTSAVSEATLSLMASSPAPIAHPCKGPCRHCEPFKNLPTKSTCQMRRLQYRSI